MAGAVLPADLQRLILATKLRLEWRDEVARLLGDHPAHDHAETVLVRRGSRVFQLEQRVLASGPMYYLTWRWASERDGWWISFPVQTTLYEIATHVLRRDQERIRVDMVAQNSVGVTARSLVTRYDDVGALQLAADLEHMLEHMLHANEKKC